MGNQSNFRSGWGLAISLAWLLRIRLAPGPVVQSAIPIPVRVPSISFDHSGVFQSGPVRPIPILSGPVRGQSAKL